MTTSTVRQIAGVMMDVDLASTATDTIRRSVRALQGFYDVNADDLSAALRISKATVYRRLNGELEFTAGEVAVLSRLFGCSLDDLYSGTLRFDNERLASRRNSASYGHARRLRIVRSDQVSAVVEVTPSHAATPIAREAASQGVDLDSAA